MDRILEQKPWYLRYKYYIVCGMAVSALIIYAISLSVGPSHLYIDEEEMKTDEAKMAPFLEYVDVEGLVQPIRTLRVNTRESGNVLRILAEEGQTIHQGDTILVLSNPELERTIEDQRDDLERQHAAYEEQKIEQEKLRIQLQKQTLQAHHEKRRLDKNIILDREEHSMGIKSKAQLEVAEDEYSYQQRRTELDMLSLRNDSASAVLRSQIMARDMEREQKKYRRSCDRLEELVVLAPCDGQLSYISATLGQRIGAGEQIAEIKVLTDYKVHTSLNEYYIDRIASGLPANIKYQNEKYPLHITKVVPEVRNRTFDVDLVFEQDRPSNIRVGKSYRVQIELGKAEEVLVISRGDFYQRTGGQWIYKLDASGERAVKTPISIGRQNPSQYEIIEGLKAGDRVITTGYDKMGDTEVVILK
ncbi:MAG: HlyD family efflux transporter periplasmic adaptor subunit [Bacteroidales bacterium]|nr:HlyD family efflux transporter periplasmic adaptor subunit [Bacteroidales bacterium]